MRRQRRILAGFQALATSAGPTKDEALATPFEGYLRKLEEPGLTESLSPGYRLSPRGQAVYEALGDA